MVGYDYLKAHPPVDCEFPYQIRCVLSYCNTRIHTGYLYMVSRFKLAQTNKTGIQTWMKTIGALSYVEDVVIRCKSMISPRSMRIRNARISRKLQMVMDVDDANN
jgi:hypothetical protein